jgi:hypothetical protein
LPSSKLDLAYAAGAIDSDGHISCTRKIGARGAYIYMPRIGIGQINRTVPDWFAATFEVGRVYEIEPKNGRIRMFIWQAYTAQAASVARLLIPFLKIKVRQAELVVEMAETIVARGSSERRDVLYAGIRECQQPRRPNPTVPVPA